MFHEFRRCLRPKPWWHPFRHGLAVVLALACAGLIAAATKSPTAGMILALIACPACIFLLGAYCGDPDAELFGEPIHDAPWTRYRRLLRIRRRLGWRTLGQVHEWYGLAASLCAARAETGYFDRLVHGVVAGREVVVFEVQEDCGEPTFTLYVGVKFSTALDQRPLAGGAGVSGRYVLFENPPLGDMSALVDRAERIASPSVPPEAMSPESRFD